MFYNNKPNLVKSKALKQRVVIDVIAQSLTPFYTLKKFPHGLGYGQRCTVGTNKFGEKTIDFAWHWMGSEGRTLLLILPYVLWNICGSDIPDILKNTLFRFNRMLVAVTLQHSLSILEEHTDATCRAMDLFHAEWQHQVFWLAERVDGIKTGFPKFHFGCHESSFIPEHGAATMTAQHVEAELGYSAKKSAKRTNMQVDTMALQQDRSRLLVTTINQDAFVLNEKGARGPNFCNLRGPAHPLGPAAVKNTQTDIHMVKSRLEGEKCQKFASTVFHTLKNLAPHAAKKLALQVNHPAYVYNKETDIGDNMDDYTLPYGSFVTTTPSCRIAGNFIRAELVPSRVIGNLRRPRSASFVQVFNDDEAEYGKVISIFQVIRNKDTTNSIPDIYL